MTIYILYSADYELYLGGNYCDEIEVLVNPTYHLLNIFDDLNIPLTLFADTLSILRYKEQNLFTFPDSAENQLKDAIRRGHDVQSHIHPHWDYTQILNNEYKINLNYFLLGKLDEDPFKLYSKIFDLLVESKDYLNNLLTPIDRKYNCIAFRCGGYGLQPNCNIIIKALINSGFIIDSSIVPNLIQKSNVNEIDFSIVPKISNYYLDNDITLPSKLNQGIFEIPIGSCKLNIIENFEKINRLLKFLKNKTHLGKSNLSTNIVKGYPIQQKENKSKTSRYYKLLISFADRFYHLDCTTNENLMFLCTKRYLEQFDFVNQDIFFSFNMHPKNMTDDHFVSLKNYQKHLIRHYGKNIKAITFRHAAEMLGNK